MLFHVPEYAQSLSLRLFFPAAFKFGKLRSLFPRSIMTPHQVTHAHCWSIFRAMATAPTPSRITDSLCPYAHKVWTQQLSEWMRIWAIIRTAPLSQGSKKM